MRIVNGLYLSEKITQRVAVAQNDKLSPLLFSLFVADLPEIIENCDYRCIIYADDLVLTSDKIFDVQLARYRIRTYCYDNKLQVNVGKKAMNFRKGRRLKRTDKLTYLMDPIEFVNSFCYLGVALATQSN